MEDEKRKQNSSQNQKQEFNENIEIVVTDKIDNISCYSITKQIQLVVPLQQDQLNFFIELMEMLSDNFLQKVTINQNSSLTNLNMEIEYDVKNIEQLSQVYRDNKIIWDEQSLLFMIKKIIELVAFMENKFCSFPEISQRMIKIYPLREQDQTKFNLRMLNPFLQTNFLMKFIKEIVVVLSQSDKGMNTNLSLLKLNSKKKFLKNNKKNSFYHEYKKLSSRIDKNSKNDVYQMFFSILCIGLQIQESYFDSSEHRFYKLLKDSINKLDCSEHFKSFFEFILLRDDLNTLPTFSDLRDEMENQKKIKNNPFFVQLNEVESIDFKIDMHQFFQQKKSESKDDSYKEQKEVSSEKDKSQQQKDFRKKLEDFYNQKKEELNQENKNKIIATPLKEEKTEIQELQEHNSSEKKEVQLKRTLCNKNKSSKDSTQNVFNSQDSTPVKESDEQSKSKISYNSPNFKNKKYCSFTQNTFQKEKQTDEDNGIEQIHNKIQQLTQKIQLCRDQLKNSCQMDSSVFQSKIQDKITFTQSEYKEETQKVDATTINLVKNLDAELADLEIKHNPFVKNENQQNKQEKEKENFNIIKQDEDILKLQQDEDLLISKQSQHESQVKQPQSQQIEQPQTIQQPSYFSKYQNQVKVLYVKDSVLNTEQNQQHIFQKDQQDNQKLGNISSHIQNENQPTQRVIRVLRKQISSNQNIDESEQPIRILKQYRDASIQAEPLKTQSNSPIRNEYYYQNQNENYNIKQQIDLQNPQSVKLSQIPSLIQDECIQQSLRNFHNIHTSNFQKSYLNYSSLFQKLLGQKKGKQESSQIDVKNNQQEVQKSLRTSMEMAYLKRAQSQQRNRYFTNMYDSLVHPEKIPPKTNLRVNQKTEYY